MRSYERFGAGIDHDLVLLLKGFAPGARARERCLKRAAAAGNVGSFDVADAGFDLTAYAAAAQRLAHDRVCFLNSFSELLAEDWLVKLAEALDVTAVGLAGSSGSWESTFSLAARQAGIRNAYARAFPDRRALVRTLHEMGGTQPATDVAERLFAAKMMLLNARQSPRFPAAHVRTNGFLIDRRLFQSLRMGNLTNKRAAYRFEGGRRSMTAQVYGRGLEVVVVDRYGIVRHPGRWADGSLFRQGDQADLLVADNQTRAYDSAAAEHRAVLSRSAWGPQGRPA